MPHHFLNHSFPEDPTISSVGSNQEALKAWYERMFNYLVKKGYSKGGFDRNLFIKRSNNDVIVAQIYVDDIMFGVTSHRMVDHFVEHMRSEY